MKKSYIITVAILLIAIGATAFALLKDSGELEEVTTTTPYSNVDTQEYLNHVKSEGEIAAPLLKSDISGIYYTITTGGDVQFYKYENNSLVKTDETGSFDVTVKLSGEELTAKVHYILNDGKITGCGLFTTQIYDASNIYYQYAFFKIMNLPSSFAKTGNYLLLVDTVKEDFYKQDKLYKEPYYYNLSTNKLGERFLNEENRLPGLNGEKRQDYSMLNNELIKDCADEILFLSSRHYQLSGDANKTDIFISGYKSHNNDDNYRMIQNIAGNYARNTSDGGVRYLANNEDGSFALTLHKGIKKDSADETVRQFAGKYEDYLRSGDYLLHIATNTVYNLVTNEEAVLNVGAENFKADTFSIDAQTKNIFMRGFSQGGAAVALGTLGGGQFKVLFNEIFLDITNPMVSSDGAVVASVSTDGTLESFKYYIFTFA